MTGSPEQLEMWAARTLELDLDDGGCISVVVGCSAESVLEALGGDLGIPLIGGEDSCTAHVYITRAGEILVAEPWGGYQGMRPEVIEPLSAGGRAASIQWSIDSNSTLTLAQAGQVLWEKDVAMDGFRTLPPEAGGALRGRQYRKHWIGAALIAIDRFTAVGLPLSSADLTAHGSFPLIPVPDRPPLAIASPPHPGRPLKIEDLNNYCRWWTSGVVRKGDEFVLELVGAAALVPERGRALAAYAVRAAAAAGEITDREPRFAAVLNELDAGRTPQLPAGVTAYISKHFHLPYGVEPPADMVPLEVLRAACDPDPVRAGLDAMFLTYSWFAAKSLDAENFIDDARLLLQR